MPAHFAGLFLNPCSLIEIGEIWYALSQYLSNLLFEMLSRRNYEMILK